MQSTDAGISEELDRLVPRTDARVVMNVYGGGPDRSRITATETGYLRLGFGLPEAAVPCGQRRRSD